MVKGKAFRVALVLELDWKMAVVVSKLAERNSETECFGLWVWLFYVAASFGR